MPETSACAARASGSRRSRRSLDRLRLGFRYCVVSESGPRFDERAGTKLREFACGRPQGFALLLLPQVIELPRDHVELAQLGRHVAQLIDHAPDVDAHEVVL